MYESTCRYRTQAKPITGADMSKISNILNMTIHSDCSTCGRIYKGAKCRLQQEFVPGAFPLQKGPARDGSFRHLQVAVCPRHPAGALLRSVTCSSLSSAALFTLCHRPVICSSLSSAVFSDSFPRTDSLCMPSLSSSLCRCILRRRRASPLSR